MDISALINDKTLKPKEKTEQLGQWILDSVISVPTLVKFADGSKESVKATCMEALEHATKVRPGIANASLLDFAVKSLRDKAPRVKWESARVIGNIAYLFPGNLEESVKNLLENAEYKGTVVRWSAAYALGEIVKLKTVLNCDLIPAINAIIDQEEKNSIKKILIAAVKAAVK